MRYPRIDRLAGQPRLHLRLPYHPDNRSLIHQVLGSRIRPDWNKEHRRWEIARNHLMPLAHALAAEYGAVDVVLEFNTAERCDTRCQTAEGDDCECSCLGTRHGGGLWGGGWMQVGDTTLIRPGVQVRHLRLIREDEA